MQQLIKQHCDRDIPYIHCLNHRLALVIKDTLSNILQLSDFFQLNQDLYNLFKIPQINQFYEGITLKKLIITRWDGHFSSLKVNSRNFHDICTALKKCLVAASIDSEYRAKARGYLASLEQPVNIFLVTFTMDVLSLLNIVNKTFQKSDSAYQVHLIYWNLWGTNSTNFVWSTQWNTSLTLFIPTESLLQVMKLIFLNKKKNNLHKPFGFSCDGKPSMLSRRG